MYGYPQTSSADLASTMSALRSRGVAKVELEFSGGNDEGGVDNVTYFAADGTKIDGIPTSQAYVREEFDPTTRRFVKKGYEVYDQSLAEDGSLKWGSRPATEDEVKWGKVRTVLEGPVEDRYGSFAGEFYVNGTVTWDVATGKHEMHGQESHEVWDDF